LRDLHDVLRSASDSLAVTVLVIVLAIAILVAGPLAILAGWLG